MRTKLGIYCPGNGTGGPWRYVHAILAGLDPDEFDTVVFCNTSGVYSPRPWIKLVSLDAPDNPSNPMYDFTSDPKRATKPTMSRWLPRDLKMLAGFARDTWRLARLFRNYPADIFHTQNTGCEESPVAAKLAGIRRVLGTFHVDSTYDLHRERHGASHRLLEIVSNRCLDTALAVSHATKRDWLRRTHIPAERVVTIHNGIDPDKFQRRQTRGDARRKLGLPEHGLIVGGLGRLDEAKGFAFLLDAAARLRSEFPHLIVAIAGAGPLRESLEAQAERLGLAGVVRFLGFQTDVQMVLDALDVFAIPSLCEALPFALLEAMATELPAVGAAVGGIPEVIVEGETGFVVPPRNPEQLAASLRTLLLDAELRTRMGTAARRRVIRDFHERDMVRKTIEVYRRAS